MTSITLDSAAELAWQGGRVPAGDGTSIATSPWDQGLGVVIVHGGLGQGAEWAHIARDQSSNRVCDR